MCSTRLQEHGSFRGRYLKEQRDHIVSRLLVQGSALALVLMFGWWGIVVLGSHTLALETNSPTAGRCPTYVVECPLAETLKKSSAQADVGRGKDCSAKAWPHTHTTTSRQPGAGPAEQAHRVDSQREAQSPANFRELHPSSAPFLKGGKQKCASGTEAVSAYDPTPKDWLSGLAAGWRLSSLGRSRNYPQSTVRQRPVGGIYATTPR